MKNISIYVGSRANYSSAFSIMKAIQKHPELNLIFSNIWSSSIA